MVSLRQPFCMIDSLQVSSLATESSHATRARDFEGGQVVKYACRSVVSKAVTVVRAGRDIITWERRRVVRLEGEGDRDGHTRWAARPLVSLLEGGRGE